jgi:hypothetical protein
MEVKMSPKNENEKSLIKIPVFSFKGNENIKVRVGFIEGDVYNSERKHKHFFRIFDGFGLGIDVYNFLIEHGVNLIRLYQDNKIYESEISQWKHCSRWDNELKTGTIDPQYILELSKMKKYEMNVNIYQMKGGVKMEDLDKIGPVQSASVDLAKYDKTLTTIEKAEITQLSSQFTPLIPNTQQHYMQYVLKVSSVVLESIREGEDKIEFRATEVFNLVQDDKGKLIGFPTGDGAKLMKFLKDLKIPSPEHLKSLQEVINALKGKQVIIKAETKIKDGRTNTYLRFRY